MTARASFAGELVCNADYHTDLPIVEREREERAPRLSANFLKQHVNAEQRALIVAFMLHLGVSFLHEHSPTRESSDDVNPSFISMPLTI